MRRESLVDGTEVERAMGENQGFDIEQLWTAGGAETKVYLVGNLSLDLALCWHHVLDRIGADVRSSGESSFRCYLLARESEHDVCQAGCELSRAEGLAMFERLREQQQDEQSGSKGTRQRIGTLPAWARRCMCFGVSQRGPRMHNHEYVRAAMMS